MSRHRQPAKRQNRHRRPRLVYAGAGTALAAAIAGGLLYTGGVEGAQATPLAAEGTGLARALAAADRAVRGGREGVREGGGEDFVRTSVTAWAGNLYYTAYRRTYHGLPVAGGDAVVLADGKGAVRDLAAAPAPVIDVGTTAKVPATAALATARRQLPAVDTATAPDLTVFLKKDKARLAWHTRVAGRSSKNAPSVLDTYVDALTGKVLRAAQKVAQEEDTGYHNGPVTIDTDATSMTDPAHPGFQCGNQSGRDFTGTAPWGNGRPNNLRTACVDIMYAAQQEHAMLKEWFGYNGQNGEGSMVPAQAGLDEVNAFYDGSRTIFGHNQNSTMQLTTIDVVAHEYGHEIFDKTPGSTGDSPENGGMNESTGDIFGALTEAYANNSVDTPDYTVGEMADMTGDGKPIRYMYDPSQAGDPNCYPELRPDTEVHSGAGPQNHWFYLLAEGSEPGGGKPGSPICAGGPASVTGVGIKKAGKIFLGALLSKTSSWDHLAARKATLTSAQNTYGGAECAAVKAAWDAVGVPAQPGETECKDIPSPAPSAARIN
ncbi:M4 family metallopeptidase [Streptomyces sp. NPDC089919]|uniref:M4 family metallopeptidase n=1 Tax=Streptomyces sp. NPDC089919 TaxID=3155188 RepID=UPI0034278645